MNTEGMDNAAAAAVMPHKHWQYAPKSNGVIIDRIKEENNLNTIPEEGQCWKKSLLLLSLF